MRSTEKRIGAEHCRSFSFLARMTRQRLCSSLWTLAACFTGPRIPHKHGVSALLPSASRLSKRVPLSPSVDISGRRMSSSSTAPTLQPGDALFGKFIIPADSIFYRSPGGTIAFVNLRPIVPGHVLIIPGDHICAYMSELTQAEYVDLWQAVLVVQSILREHYACTAFNVGVQDGRAAGQSVPHGKLCI